MSGVHGVVEISKVLEVMVEGLNVASKISHKGGVLAALALVDELSGLGSLNLDELKKEVSELDAADAKALEALVQGKLNLVNKVVEAKIKAAPALVLEVLSVAQDVLAAVGKVKAFIGV